MHVGEEGNAFSVIDSGASMFINDVINNKK